MPGPSWHSELGLGLERGDLGIHPRCGGCNHLAWTHLSDFWPPSWTIWKWSRQPGLWQGKKTKQELPGEEAWRQGRGGGGHCQARLGCATCPGWGEARLDGTSSSTIQLVPHVATPPQDRTKEPPEVWASGAHTPAARVSGPSELHGSHECDVRTARSSSPPDTLQDPPVNSGP